MKKIFYRCNEALDTGRVIFERGDECGALDVPLGYRNKFERIERDCFEAHYQEWYRHTPGDPMPCDGDRAVVTINQMETDGEIPFSFCCEKGDWWNWDAMTGIIGWRYADDAKPAPKDWTEYPHATTGQPFLPKPDSNKAMKMADLAAVEDSTLSPTQRKHWNEMEAKQAAREQLKHDAESKSLQERADQLADAGKAMDRVNQDHNHRMGWMA